MLELLSPPTAWILSIAAESTGSASRGASLLKGVSLASLTAGLSQYALSAAEGATGTSAAALLEGQAEVLPPENTVATQGIRRIGGLANVGQHAAMRCGTQAAGL